jgi:hypothetical protein
MARVRKSRLVGFPEADGFPWSYAEFATRYGKDIVEKSPQKITLISADQVAELKQLLENIRIPDGQLDKWLTAAGADTIDELDADKAIKIIGHLKAKLAKPEGKAA